MEVGDIVEYKGRQWYLNRIYGNGLCQIVILRNGKHNRIKHFKQGNYEWEEEYLNANINNLPIEEIK